MSTGGAMTHDETTVETLKNPLTGHRAHLLWRDGLGLLVDPQPEVLPLVLDRLDRLGITPVAVLETCIRAGSGVSSPARLLARTMGWPWVGPVVAWETEGVVLEIGGQHIELDPEAPDDAAPLRSRAAHTTLRLDPFEVRVQPVTGQPGQVALLAAGHLFTGLPEGELPVGVDFPPGTTLHAVTNAEVEDTGVEVRIEDGGWDSLLG